MLCERTCPIVAGFRDGVRAFEADNANIFKKLEKAKTEIPPRACWEAHSPADDLISACWDPSQSEPHNYKAED